MEHQEQYRILRMTCLRFDLYKISPTQKMDKIEVKEVIIISHRLTSDIVRDKSRAICELLSDP